MAAAAAVVKMAKQWHKHLLKGSILGEATYVSNVWTDEAIPSLELRPRWMLGIYCFLHSITKDYGHFIITMEIFYYDNNTNDDDENDTNYNENNNL